MSLPQSIPQGYMTIIVPRPDTERLLSGNYRGYATAALSLQPPPGPPPPLPVAPPAQPKDPVGLYGFANAAYKDRDNELRSHCGDFTRKNAVGDFNELCSSVGRHCQWVCDWEGHAKACGENPNDGTRLAMCQ